MKRALSRELIKHLVLAIIGSLAIPLVGYLLFKAAPLGDSSYRLSDGDFILSTLILAPIVETLLMTPAMMLLQRLRSFGGSDFMFWAGALIIATAFSMLHDRAGYLPAHISLFWVALVFISFFDRSSAIGGIKPAIMLSMILHAGYNLVMLTIAMAI